MESHHKAGQRKKRSKANMNTNYRRVPTRFAPEIRFEVRPAPAAPLRALQETIFEPLKERLLVARLEEAVDSQLEAPLRAAASDAAALAWVTSYPLLVYPVLFEEKAQAALLCAERQEEVRQRSRDLLAV